MYTVYDRKSSQRAIEELQRTIIEIETKYKAELGRLKKKFETDLREYEIQIETLNRTNAELNKGNKSIVGKIRVDYQLHFFFFFCQEISLIRLFFR